MSVVVDVTVPSASFTLERSLSAEPAMSVEAERLATHSAEWVMPYLWASGGDFDGFEDAMADDPTVADSTVVEESDDGVLYQVIWHDGFVELINEMIDQHANILEAKASADTWRLTLRFSDEGDVSAFRDYFEERGHVFAVQRIFHPSSTRQREYGLTAEQRDALVAALWEGYFEVPRSTSIEELADALGVSSNATSQRLRRATGNLVRNTLTVGEREGSDGR